VQRDISAEDGVAAVAAISVEHVADTFSGAHAGYAAHPDAEVAVLRAITEVAQSRAVDIQGMREDLELPGKAVQAWNVHVRRGRPDLDLWPYREAQTPASFDALPHRPSDDVVADIRVLLDVLRGRGLDRVLVVDLSPAWLPVKVVRVIVPGAESFGIDQSKLGPRSGKHWDATLRALIARRDGAA
jgi:ribosomal protein S12 methylthiotransferase accessory factor